MDGNIIVSQEGTTQGDPLTMPMYALATIPLIKNLKTKDPEIIQIWLTMPQAQAKLVNLGIGGIISIPLVQIMAITQ